ncbi:MAG: hypothetical protein U0931_31335 [Vulcanimicrobiota bacterium]
MLKKAFILLACAATLWTTGCGGDSSTGNNGALGTATNPGSSPSSSSSPAAATFNLTFQSNGNADVTAFASGGNNLAVTQATPSNSAPTRIQTNFTVSQISGQTVLLRTISLVVAKATVLAAGENFTFANPLVTPGAFADYTEQGQPALKRWVSTGGSLTFNSVSAAGVNVTFNNLLLNPAGDAGNTATGTITVSGTAQLTF